MEGLTVEQVSARPLSPLVLHVRHPSPAGCTIGPLGATLPDRHSYDTDGGQKRAKHPKVHGSARENTNVPPKFVISL